jgi:hypothetical protein
MRLGPDDEGRQMHARVPHKLASFDVDDLEDAVGEPSATRKLFLLTAAQELELELAKLPC